MIAAIYRSVCLFSKHSRPRGGIKNRERTSGQALSDDKSGKIAKAEQEQQQKMAQENLKRKIEMERLKLTQPKIHTWSAFYESALELKEQQVAVFQDLSESVEGARRFHNKYPIGPADISDIVNKQFKLKQHNYDEEPFAEPKRSGVIATKVGMTATWDKWGYRHVLTVLQMDRNQVVQVKTDQVDGHFALQIGAGEANLKTLKKPQMGHFLRANIPPKQYIKEFRVTPENILPVGYMLTARHFTVGQLVDVYGVSCGKGFAGTIKRHNFGMQPATHGCSLSHRVLGSTGGRQDPGRVFKGKKMPGRLGGEKTHVENLKVYKVDAVRQLIYVRGSVPGKQGSVVYIKDALKGSQQNEELINYPTLVIEEGKEYAREITLEAPEEDPEMYELHENDMPKAGEDAEE